VRRVSRLAKVVIPLGLLAAFAAGCGKSSTASTTSTSSRAAVSTTPPASGCGSYAKPPIKQVGGAVDALPTAQRDMYPGYSGTVKTSAWKNWKPAGNPPYTVGVVWGQLLNDFQVKATTELRAALKKSPLVGNVDFRSTGNNLDVGQQLQLFRQMIQRHPAAIVLEENESQPFIPLINQAGKAGIPTIIFGDSVATPYALNVYFNAFDAVAKPTSYMVRTLGDKGNVLYVHNIPGLTYDTDSFNGATAVLKNCPQVKKVGDVYGDFDSAIAKSQTLKFLATHPQPINGVVQVATMGPGVMSAFQQAGRPIPMMVDVSAMNGSLGYWASHRKTYTGVGSSLDPVAVADGTANVAHRLLEGQGPKVTDLLGQTPLITDQNLDQWVPKGATLATPGAAVGPPNNFFSDSDLNPLFEKGAPPKQG
jgi:ribose transport system substrate-binding protein